LEVAPGNFHLQPLTGPIPRLRRGLPRHCGEELDLSPPLTLTLTLSPAGRGEMLQAGF